MFTIFSADIIGNTSNCSYPHRFEITNTDSLKAAISHDYVCADYKNHYRSNDNFVGSNCLPVDCDNDHSDVPEDWISPDKISEVFPGVSFAIHYSRHHNKEKDGKTARPRFHVLFPIDFVTSAEDYRALKQQVNTIFPYFDNKALDAARFFFGTTAAEVEIHEGIINLSDFLDNTDDFEDFDAQNPTIVSIQKGSRNSTMSRFASRVLKKYGNTEDAYQVYLGQAQKCDPPLPAEELQTIWRSALKFFTTKVQAQPGYIPPEVYNDDTSYKPEDYSDTGQAEVLAKHFSNELRYSDATHYIRYMEHYWKESESDARAVVHELTHRQLKNAAHMLQEALKEMETSGARTIIDKKGKTAGSRKLETDAQQEAFNKYQDAATYMNFVRKRRDSGYITATLKEAQSMLMLQPQELDADGFALCTPDATYDLRKGMSGAREHSPEDLCTKITAVSPSDKGHLIWEDCLDTIFCYDKELITYVQRVCGLAAIGKVFVEALIIAYGCGRNGKSTFWNVISKVLGLYSGNISADTLTAGCRRNTKYELAEVRGKRLLIAAELQEGALLNDSMVKQLCSTDDIFAEKKYKDPLAFTPCHTLVLYTNHLPRVKASDDGTWRRLIVVPFNAVIEGTNDKKNYADYLFNNAGESILAWIIEGARQVIDLDYKIPMPKCVREAIDAYRAENDWFQHFLDDRCTVGDNLMESSQRLFEEYRNYAEIANEPRKNTTAFYKALEKAGFIKTEIQKRRYFKGLQIRASDFEGNTQKLE